MLGPHLKSYHTLLCTRRLPSGLFLVGQLLFVVTAMICQKYKPFLLLLFSVIIFQIFGNYHVHV